MLIICSFLRDRHSGLEWHQILCVNLKIKILFQTACPNCMIIINTTIFLHDSAWVCWSFWPLGDLLGDWCEHSVFCSKAPYFLCGIRMQNIAEWNSLKDFVLRNKIRGKVTAGSCCFFAPNSNSLRLQTTASVSSFQESRLYNAVDALRLCWRTERPLAKTHKMLKASKKKQNKTFFWIVKPLGLETFGLDFIESVESEQLDPIQWSWRRFAPRPRGSWLLKGGWYLTASTVGVVQDWRDGAKYRYREMWIKRGIEI